MLKKLFNEKRWHTLFLEISKNLAHPDLDIVIQDLLSLASKLYPVELATVFVLYTNKLDRPQSIQFLEQAISNVGAAVLFGPEHKEAMLFMRLHKLLFELPVRNIEEDIYEILANEFQKDSLVDRKKSEEMAFNKTVAFKNTFSDNMHTARSTASKMSKRCFFVFNILCRRYFESVGDYAAALVHAKDEFFILRDALLAENVYALENIFLKCRLDDFRNLQIGDDSEARMAILGIETIDAAEYNPNDLWTNTRHMVDIYFAENDRNFDINELRKLYDLVRAGKAEEIGGMSFPLPRSTIQRKASIIRILKRAQVERTIHLDNLDIDFESALDYALDLLGSGIIVGYIDERKLIVTGINENILGIREIESKLKQLEERICDTLDLCGIN